MNLMYVDERGDPVIHQNGSPLLNMTNLVLYGNKKPQFKTGDFLRPDRIKRIQPSRLIVRSGTPRSKYFKLKR